MGKVKFGESHIKRIPKNWRPMHRREKVNRWLDLIMKKNIKHFLASVVYYVFKYTIYSLCSFSKIYFNPSRNLIFIWICNIYIYFEIWSFLYNITLCVFNETDWLVFVIQLGVIWFQFLEDEGMDNVSNSNNEICWTIGCKAIPHIRRVSIVIWRTHFIWSLELGQFFNFQGLLSSKNLFARWSVDIIKFIPR